MTIGSILNVVSSVPYLPCVFAGVLVMMSSPAASSSIKTPGETGRGEARAWTRRIEAAELDFTDSDEVNIAYAQAIVRCAAAKPSSRPGDVRVAGRAARKR